MTADPYLWLEDITGDDALAWVRAHNDSTLAELSGERFETMRSEILEILDTDARIPYPGRRGEYLYNFWRDEANPRGLWRRTTLESYRTDDPDWDVILDLDELARTEGENWVWAGPEVIEPEHTLAMISLSRGGADATVVREFDMRTREFVSDGFELAEAKSSVSWEDEDTLLVCTEFGEGSMTESGYPRIAKRWRRGEPLTNAETVYEAEPTDVRVIASIDRTPGFEHTRLGRYTDFYNRIRFEVRDGELIELKVPTDSSLSLHREWLLISLRTDWQVGEVTYPAGALLGTTFDDFLSGTADLTMIYEPDAHSCLSSVQWTKEKLILITLRDVASHVEVVTPGTWEHRDAPDIPPAADTIVVDIDHLGDEVFYNSSGFTTPSRLLHGTAGGPLVQLKSAPAFYDADGIGVEQHFATSKDGTKVPYFVVGRHEEPSPTYLYGYGGFQNSLTPGYIGGVGRAWLARGGTYVQANIRGGGEYGPGWHKQAMRENRHVVYEDFAAIAADLVRRGITTVEQLGASGGSNGGLLMGVMLTHYPELFGALVCSVPLLDMKRFHLLLAGASWVAEYGNPDDPADWEFMSKYSPYQNISKSATYPPILITTSTRDDRVHPGHARKMTAALAAAGHRVLYYENIEGGHGGAADNKQAAFKAALTHEFLWQTLGS
ncbi:MULTISPECIES: prolyl oligopeptidase family protein [unclassified Mycolicibacterium]|uniref:prolyl oligopeptidase family serine peptidase n=1 Tax=unclassified Mycolicibacterium TaxID=2636767 RepID=UPI00130A10FD|nr:MULTISPECIES: prolyl oligopeptidase family serine peptidase [unclassified Mycolicibacterium]MUL81781.1 S9 family peptidase [Mycolicibacterium sp. CBMA 329]MUL87547.1 S9 family peptidase [Mycolicibacterium sp. CBMA 331]MUL99589.1 S9 family peptidase [Mycolicibacterium sp. CBMA 334]MUM26686.1 S9 family peptidase [Mycolicibacterium sp. CBMA 295]MUM37844.1 S9 family peptidase [Mycolicibacterium sp. CBMA 247]